MTNDEAIEAIKAWARINLCTFGSSTRGPLMFIRPSGEIVAESLFFKCGQYQEIATRHGCIGILPSEIWFPPSQAEIVWNMINAGAIGFTTERPML